MMNCQQARALLPLLLTGDLDTAEHTVLTGHLAVCPDCQGERAALESVRRALDTVPSPPAQVDVARIYREAAERQKRALRRWRRAAVAGMALAACLVLVLLFRLDIEVGNGQFVVRWGPRPQPAPAAPQPQPPAPAAIVPANTELEERVKILGELVRMLGEDIATRDRQRQKDIAVLVARLEVLTTREQRRWEENRRDVGALYTAQFGQRE